jgi:hypothetical protein
VKTRPKRCLYVRALGYKSLQKQIKRGFEVLKSFKVFGGNMAGNFRKFLLLLWKNAVLQKKAADCHGTRAAVACDVLLGDLHRQRIGSIYPPSPSQ